MKNRIITLIFLFLLIGISTFAQTPENTPGSWSIARAPLNSFIENKGQFNARNTSNTSSEIQYGYDGKSEDFYFTNNGVIIELTLQEKRKKSDEEKKEREAKKLQGFKDAADFRAFEEIGHTMKIEKEELSLQWIGANPNVQILMEEKDNQYHSYSFYDEKGQIHNVNYLESWKKLTYKNLYPNIDVIYEIHPKSGFKYSVIVHPGGDISKVQLQYSKNAILNADGTISTPTIFGNITDHAPLTFYANNKNEVVQSSYNLENNIVTFKVGKYDKTKTLVIDPWTQMPNFVSTNWDSIWECERDGAGNVYVFGGTSPVQIIKYSSLGIPVWTYNTPYDTTEWLGTFAVDLAGNSYVANGSPAKIFKLNTAAGLVWNNTNPGGLLALTEFWNITFNCDQTKLLIGGTDGSAFGGPEPWIFDINMNSGNVSASVRVHAGNGLSPTNAQEVRSVAACNNGKYYFLSHDSIGWIHQSLTTCSGTPNSIYRINSGLNLSYKCENWRYNNTGLMALAHYNGFVFVHKGNQLQKRTFATGAIVGTVTIPGGTFTSGFGGNVVGCSGIDIDDCGNIFVGSTNGVYKFDQSLAQLASYPASFNVYDVEVNSAGEVIAGGSTGNSGSGARTGYIQSFAAAACTPQAIVCCDATVCPVGPLCIGAPAVPMIVTTPGGTFSASCGTCINATTGVFNPSLAGIGTHTIIYTLPCGSETTTVVVNGCSALVVCQELNGTLTVTGGTGPYTWSQWNPGGNIPITTQAQCLACNASYTWFGGTCLNGFFPVSNCNVPAGYVTFATGSNVPLPTPVTYPVRVVDNAGTIFTISGPGVVPPCVNCPTFNIAISGQTNPTCFGQSTGSFTVTTTLGASPYTYFLMNGSTLVTNYNAVSGAQLFSGLPAGTYTLNILDNNNCQGTTTIIITQPTVVNVTYTSINTGCGQANGSIDISVAGGTTGYTYNWSNTATTQDVTGLLAGNYTVTVTDANGCSTTNGPIAITSTAGVTVTVNSAVNATCGQNNGSIDISVAGGTPTYSYLWSNTATAQDITGLGAGNYTVTVADANGCTATNGPIAISQTPAITITLDNTTNASCGSNNGTISISVSGGTAGYTYLWSNTNTTQDITGLGAGGYTVTVTDASGCTMSSSFTVNSASGLNISIDSVHAVSCNGGNDGFVNITVSSGTPSYTYLWSNAATTQDLTGLAAGTVGLTVTDAAGCSITSGLINITQPSVLNIALNNSANATCGFNNGSIDINVSGGTGTYTYLWSNTTTTQDITGLGGGTYTITVADANGCTATNSFNLTQESAITITLDSTVDATCGLNNGNIAVSIAGGTAGYDYLWSNTDTIQDITGLGAGTYTLTVTDASGCTMVSNSIVISGSSAVTITIDSVQNVSCNGANDGFVNISVSGGTTPYNYLWSNGATSQNITGLIGTITCTVTDANGCTATTSPITIAEPSAITITVDSTSAADCGVNDGSISISVAGGVGAYTYLWSNNNVTTQDITGLGAGGYTVVVTDASGCTMASNSIIVSSSSGLNLTIDSVQAVSCNGGSDGFIDITTSGGTVPYTFLWSNTATTEDINGLTAGVYGLTITDAIGCSITSGNITVTEPSILNAALNSTTSVSCGASDGAADIGVSGGTAPYTYLWSNTATTQDITGLSVAGSYDVTITDANGCGNILNVVVGNNSGMTVSGTITNVSCFNGSNGAIDFSVTGGTTPYTYSWSNTATSQDITGLAAGNYAVTVTDNFGCFANWDTTITQAAALTLTANTDSVSCTGGADGQLTAMASGGTPNYTYVWSNSATGATATALAIGTYSVTATDANTCTASFTTSITNVTPISLIINPVQDTVDCTQAPIGALTAIASGGAGGFTYLWSNTGANAAITGLAAGFYSVTATDMNGCTSTTSDSVYALFIPSISAFVNIQGQQNALVFEGDTIFVSSGSNQTANGVTYTWTAAPTGFSFNNANTPSTDALSTESGIYSLTITAESLDGCIVSDTLLVTVQGDFIGMPNAFSPNGDNVNDTFRPIGLVSSNTLEFKVFNRWGQLLYDNSDVDNGGWNGTYMGVEQPSEVYIYLLRYRLLGQEEKMLRGEFTLIR